MKILGRKLMLQVTAYLDIYGMKSRVGTTVLVPLGSSREDIINELNKINRENSVSSWRIYRERKVFAKVKKEEQKPQYEVKINTLGKDLFFSVNISRQTLQHNYFDEQGRPVYFYVDDELVKLESGQGIEVGIHVKAKRIFTWQKNMQEKRVAV